MSRTCQEYLDAHPSDRLAIGHVHLREEPDEEEDDEDEDEDEEDEEQEDEGDDQNGGYSV